MAVSIVSLSGCSGMVGDWVHWMKWHSILLVGSCIGPAEFLNQDQYETNLLCIGSMNVRSHGQSTFTRNAGQWDGQMTKTDRSSDQIWISVEQAQLRIS